MTLLFSPLQIKDLSLKNRIMMSPMCMYSAQREDGNVTDFHLVHYASRAVGQVGLVMVEATGVCPQGRITLGDLGIWSDDHIPGLSELTRLVHESGAHIGIQLAHAGRKSEFGSPVAPSAVPYDDHTYAPPSELSAEAIASIVADFTQAAKRARTASFDVIEIHAAHGYLINQFLSPLSNRRTDAYGGSKENRYRLLREVIKGVRSVWSGPLFVRVSAEEYQEGGNTTADHVTYATWMKEDGVDLIDVSTGGLTPTAPKAFPGYQVPYAATIREEAGIMTGAVGIIVTGVQAEEILQQGSADLVIIGRELLRNPYFPLTAAKELGVERTKPVQYLRSFR